MAKTTLPAAASATNFALFARAISLSTSIELGTRKRTAGCRPAASGIAILPSRSMPSLGSAIAPLLAANNYSSYFEVRGFATAPVASRTAAASCLSLIDGGFAEIISAARTRFRLKTVAQLGKLVDTWPVGVT